MLSGPLSFLNLILLFIHLTLLWFILTNKCAFVKQNDSTAEETPATKPIVGIIYPPPEVRNIVDKTASFVARLVILYVAAF